MIERGLIINKDGNPIELNGIDSLQVEKWEDHLVDFTQFNSIIAECSQQELRNHFN